MEDRILTVNGYLNKSDVPIVVYEGQEKYTRMTIFFVVICVVLIVLLYSAGAQKKKKLCDADVVGSTNIFTSLNPVGVRQHVAKPVKEIWISRELDCEVVAITESGILHTRETKRNGKTKLSLPYEVSVVGLAADRDVGFVYVAAFDDYDDLVWRGAWQTGEPLYFYDMHYTPTRLARDHSINCLTRSGVM